MDILVGKKKVIHANVRNIEGLLTAGICTAMCEINPAVIFLKKFVLRQAQDISPN